jgi:hypothetical protein
MLKMFRKKELIESVVRVEDLQSGDLFQYDPYTRARVRQITELNPNERRIELEKIPLVGNPLELETMTFYNIMKLIVWK